MSISGTFLVSIVNYELINGSIVGKVIDEKTISSNEKKEFEFSFKGFHQKGMHTFILMGKEKDSVFYGGAYFTDEICEDELNDVNLALNMCTFMREKYITRNVNILSKSTKILMLP